MSKFILIIGSHNPEVHTPFVMLYHALYGWKSQLLAFTEELNAQGEFDGFWEPHGTSYNQFGTPIDAIPQAIAFAHENEVPLYVDTTYFTKVPKSQFGGLLASTSPIADEDNKYWKCANAECRDKETGVKKIFEHEGDEPPQVCPLCGYNEKNLVSKVMKEVEVQASQWALEDISDKFQEEMEDLVDDKQDYPKDPEEEMPF